MTAEPHSMPSRRTMRIAASARSPGSVPRTERETCSFILRTRQRPGALRDILKLRGPEDDIARFEHPKKSARNFGPVLIGIETTRASNFTDLCARLDAAGMVYTDITEDETLAEFVI